MSANLPIASGSFGQRPVLTFPATPPPEGLHVVVLEAGSGPEVRTGQRVVVNYLAQVWDGAVVDSSYDRGELSGVQFGSAAVFNAWNVGLVEQPIGSRVLLSVPPEHAYGSAGDPALGIGAEDTVVFIVDLVALA